MDDFKFQFLNMAYDLSGALRDHLLNEFNVLVISELSDSEINKYYKIAFSYIVNELADMGILFVDMSEAAADPDLIQLALHLRNVFDKEFFFKQCASTSFHDAVYEFSSSYDGDTDLYLTNLIETIYEVKSVSMTWGSIYRQRFSINNDQNFMMHINAILQREAVVSDEMMMQQAMFAKTLYDRNKLVKAAHILACAKLGIPSDIDIDVYDADLCNIPIEAVQSYVASKSPYFLNNDTKDVYYVTIHKGETPHHLEYYIAKNITELTPQELSNVVAEYAADYVKGDVYSSDVVKLLTRTSFTDSVKSSIKDLLEHLSKFTLATPTGEISE